MYSSLSPLRDFISTSDIDWSQSIADIDRQLYAKYGLSDEEIAFIEKMIKPMEWAHWIHPLLGLEYVTDK